MQQQIQPKLNTFDLTIIVISLVIGMGIFRTPVEVAQKAGTPLIFFAAWILGGVASFCGALTFAEIGSRMPAAGGFYKVFSVCYHPAFAFMVNWISVISNAASVAAVAIVGGDYIAPLVMPNVEHGLAVKIITVTSTVVLYGISMFGIKLSAKVLNALMFLKISLMLIIVAAIFKPHGTEVAIVQQTYPAANSNWMLAFAACFVPVFFTYGGYQQTINFGSDVANPQKNLPRSIFFGITAVLILYLLVNFSYFHVLGFDQLRSTKSLAADVIGVFFGSTAGKVVSVLLFFGVLAYIKASILSNPRVYYAMAEDGVLPKIFMRINGKTQVQEFTVTLFTAFILVTLFMGNSFSKILDYVMFFDSIALASAAAAVFVLRKRAKEANKDEQGIYKMKIYPYMPLLFVIVYSFVNFTVFLNNKQAFGWGFVLFLSGLPLYFLLKKLIKS
jgi:basic amino acid/polyamine antiporter, APA family